MSVKPLLVARAPGQHMFGHRVFDRYQDQPVSFMMQETIVEGRLALSKFWHRFQETKDDLRQQEEGVFHQRLGKTVS